jgi:hypothetical protein
MKPLKSLKMGREKYTWLTQHLITQRSSGRKLLGLKGKRIQLMILRIYFLVEQPKCLVLKPAIETLTCFKVIAKQAQMDLMESFHKKGNLQLYPQGLVSTLVHCYGVGYPMIRAKILPLTKARNG